MRERLAEQYDTGLLFLDPSGVFDPCVVGVAYRCGMEPVVVYDREAVIGALMQDGLDRESAEEFFEFNTAGAYVGPRTPMFLERLETTT